MVPGSELETEKPELANHSCSKNGARIRSPPVQRRQDAQGRKIHDLPEEIIVEILSRLPVKSLLKSRCVSKPWRSLIGSRKFIKTHLEISKQSSTFRHQKIVFADSSPPDQTLRHTSLHSLMNERDNIETSAFDDPMYTPADSIALVGCCNGLICILVNRKKLILWNPSTRMSKKLPDVDERIKHGFVTKRGFGFDESNDDSKVFVILSVFWVTGTYQFIGKIYSLKTNSWRILKEKDVDPFLESGKFVNGKLHWGYRFGFNYDWGIVSFDLKNEVYGYVEPPEYRAGKSYKSLGVLGGCLCVLSDYRPICLDVWVMNDYGVKESWDKVLSVPYPCDVGSGRFSTPFCIGSRGEILFIYGSSFIIYYPKEKLFRCPHTVKFGLFGEGNVYVESLVPVVPDAEQEREIQAII